MNSMSTSPLPIHVLIVDDSPTVCQLMQAVLESEPGIRVVGVATNGQEGLQMAKRLHPDVITMDINMPVMGGLDATRYIMRDAPTPIVIVTADFGRKDIDLTFESLNAGALTVVKKPGLMDPESNASLVQTVRTMAGVPVVRRWFRGPQTGGLSPNTLALTEFRATIRGNERLQFVQVIGIVASTGGPSVLETILRPLSENFPLPILIVQHITNGFAAGMADWLNNRTRLNVRLASHGEPARPGTALIAPEGYHLQINTKGYVELSHDLPYMGFRPSGNFLLHSLASGFGRRAIGVVLTGMGDDGVEGLEAMHKLGGLTIAQDEASSTVYGMPAEAARRGATDLILNPEQIGTLLTQLERKTQPR
jgi:two-component system, chemotaxis family, protein-glutamate methylesterase/glutaminase